MTPDLFNPPPPRPPEQRRATLLFAVPLGNGKILGTYIWKGNTFTRTFLGVAPTYLDLK